MSERRVAKILVALGLLAAVVVLAGRVRAEMAARTVELVLDLNDARTVADSQAIPMEDYLRQMREAGITSVGVSESTLQGLEDGGFIQLLKGKELLGFRELGGSLRPEVAKALETAGYKPGLYYAVAQDAAFGQWLADQLSRKLPQGAARLLTPPGQSPAVVEAAVSDDQVEKMGVGLVPSEVALVREAGLAVVPRLENARDVSGGYIAKILDAAGPGLHTVIFNGKQVLGYPDNLPLMAAEMKQRGLVQGLIEAPVQLGFIDQAGQIDLARLLDYQAARVYSITRAELDKYTAADAVDRQLRAVKERDIRILYVRPIFVKIDQAHRAEANLQYVRDLAAGVRQEGFQVAPVEPFGTLYPNRPLMAVMAVGIVAGSMLLLQDLLPVSPALFYLLLVLGSLGSGGLLLLSRGDLVRKALALGAALVFPSLGALWAAGVALRTRRVKAALGTLLLRSAWALVGASLIAVIAAFFIGALLGGDSRYLLEIEYFRGVKAAVTVPLLLVAWAFVYRYGVRPEDQEDEPGSHDLLRQTAWLSRRPIEAWHIALLALGAVAMYIYIGRTGHTSGLTVTGTEVEARDLLERLMIVRPRTKEFLVGHPALMLSVWAGAQGYRRWAALFLVAGAISLSSLVNSFEHLRTEFLISLWRMGNGLILGLALGWIAVAVVYWVWPWLARRWRAGGDA